MVIDNWLPLDKHDESVSSGKPASVVTDLPDTPETINHISGEVDALLTPIKIPGREEFLRCKDVLEKCVEKTNSWDMACVAFSEAIKIFFKDIDSRLADSVIISSLTTYKPEAIIQAAKEYLEKFPAAPVIFCYGSESHDLLNNMGSLGTIWYYPNVRFFNYTGSLISPPTGLKNNPFDVFRGPQYHKRWKAEIIQRNLGTIEHQLGKYRKISIDQINETTIKECSQQIQSARNIGITWDDRSVLEQIITTTIRDNWDKLHIPEIPMNMTCVDWDGTLMKDGAFQEDIFEKARKIAQKNSNNLVVWTWGGPDTLVHIQDFFKGRWQEIFTCAKQDCEWWKISYAVDDENGPDLEKKYGFQIGNLTLVS